jgi:uracil-DNA glycosylase
VRTIEDLLAEIKRCTICTKHLPFHPSPVLRVSKKASLLIIGHAPGRRAHINQLSWDDNSGDRLREWLGIEKSVFYDIDKVAMTSMGFCYPGTYREGGDKPPRPECAPQWHSKLHDLMPNIKMTLLIGAYAQKYYLRAKMKSSLTETVKSWKEYMPQFLPLPHPSWRNIGWIKKNPWFVAELLPELKKVIKNINL